MMTADRTPLPPKTAAEIEALMDVALGREPADLVVSGAELVNVYTGELQPRMSVAVKGRWIALVSPEAAEAAGPQTRVIDAAGRALAPGFIDGHTHLAWLATAAEFAPYALANGVTTAVTEMLEPYPVAGYEGVVDFLDSLKGLPLRVLATAPAMISISRAARGIPAEDLERLLARGEVLGIGESYWQAVLQDPAPHAAAFAAALRCGKLLEGHSAGASGRKLAAYAAAGISSCHEPINAEQTLDRLRLGIHVMAREGGIRRDLEAIAAIRGAGVDLRRLVLASDGASPADLIGGRYLAAAVQKAIACGFAPVAAIQMATLNAAEHFRLDGWLGGIAPGKLADFVLIPQPDRIAPETVVADGRVVFDDGRLLAEVRRHRFAEKSRNSLRLPRPLAAADFALPAPGAAAVARCRVIAMVTDLVTAEAHRELPVRGGAIAADPSGDLLKIAAIDRTHAPGRLFTGLIQGYGLRSGAVACSAAWDCSAIVVIGARDADMAAAVNRLAQIQGGAVVVDDGAVAAELPLPIFGIISEGTVPELAAGLATITQALARRGVAFPDPLLSLITLTGAAIPYFRICEEGLVNLKEGRTVGLLID
jgi:adenine deaminase